MSEQWQIRTAPSLGGLEGNASDVWGVDENYTDLKRPTLFFGLYGLPDFMALRKHEGRKAVLWAGSDIRHFISGYWLDDKGKYRVHRRPFAEYLNENAEHYVENTVEWEALQKVGIESKIVPSFMGDVKDYAITYQHSETPKVYASVSGDDFKLYQWDYIKILAADNPGIEFYLYGNKTEWVPTQKNIVVRGRVPKEVMNEEIKYMQGGLRPLEFDGFSEIVAKSFLWGQYPISPIPYGHSLDIDEMWKLHDLQEPNVEGRAYYLSIINNYPWNIKQYD